MITHLPMHSHHSLWVHLSRIVWCVLAAEHKISNNIFSSSKLIKKKTKIEATQSLCKLWHNELQGRARAENLFSAAHKWSCVSCILYTVSVSVFLFFWCILGTQTRKAKMPDLCQPNLQVLTKALPVHSHQPQPWGTRRRAAVLTTSTLTLSKTR